MNYGWSGCELFHDEWPRSVSQRGPGRSLDSRQRLFDKKQTGVAQSPTYLTDIKNLLIVGSGVLVSAVAVG